MKPKSTHRFLAISALFWIPVMFFSYLAGEILERQPLAFDTHILNWIHAHTSNTLDTLFLLVTTIGNAEIITPLVLLITGMLWYNKYKRQSLVILISFFGAAAANITLKFLFHRDRPTFWQSALHETGYSFPSGHAMMSSALVFACIAVAWHTRLRCIAIVAGAIFMLAIGYSRLYLGVHYPTDILAGWLASFAWVAIVYYALNNKLGFIGIIKKRGHR